MLELFNLRGSNAQNNKKIADVTSEEINYNDKDGEHFISDYYEHHLVTLISNITKIPLIT